MLLFKKLAVDIQDLNYHRYNAHTKKKIHAKKNYIFTKRKINRYAKSFSGAFEEFVIDYNSVMLYCLY